MLQNVGKRPNLSANMVLDAAGHRWTDAVGVDVGRFWEPEFGPSWYFVKLCCVKDAWGGARVGVGQALQGAAMVVDCQCECIEGVSAYKPFKSFLNSGICTLGFHYNGWKLGQWPDVLCVAVWGS